jgi:hypothetical protein
LGLSHFKENKGVIGGPLVLFREKNQIRHHLVNMATIVRYLLP